MKPCKHSDPCCAACCKNREKVRAWHAANPAKAARKARRWAKRHKRKRRASWLAYYHRHAQVRYANARRLREYADRGAVVLDPSVTIRQVYDDDDGTCHLCHQFVPDPWTRELVDFRERATIDHVMPLADGGQHVRENCRLAHWACNVRRGRKPLPATG